MHTHTDDIPAALSGARPVSPHDRREAAASCFAARRGEIEALARRYREAGRTPREIPGIRRMLAAARQAKHVMRAIDVELQRA